MTSPFLDIAIGALRGSKENRQRAEEREERRRRREREELELRLRMAEAASGLEPDTDQFPYADAGIQAATPPIAPPERGNITQADVGRVPSMRGTLTQADAGPSPDVDGGPGAVAGGGDATPPPPRPGVPPEAAPPRGALTNEAIALIAQLRAQPGRTRGRAEANNRRAYEALHRRNPEAYPEYIEGMEEGYYADLLARESEHITTPKRYAPSTREEWLADQRVLAGFRTGSRATKQDLGAVERQIDDTRADLAAAERRRPKKPLVFLKPDEEEPAFNAALADAEEDITDLRQRLDSLHVVRDALAAELQDGTGAPARTDPRLRELDEQYRAALDRGVDPAAAKEVYDRHRRQILAGTL